MDRLIEVRCPNCGSLAQRLLSDRLPIYTKCPDHLATQTECQVCDYFLVVCQQNGKVLDAYSPGRREELLTVAFL
jgi:ribosomal protein S27E